MDHIRVVTDEAQISDALDDIAESRIDIAKAKQDGARFMAAFTDASFDVPRFDIVNRRSFDAEGLENAYEALVKSLNEQPEAKLSAASS